MYLCVRHAVVGGSVYKTHPECLEAGLHDHVAVEGLQAEDALGKLGDGLLGQEGQALNMIKQMIRKESS